MRAERSRAAMGHDHIHPHQPRQHGPSHPQNGAVVDRRAALRSGALGIGALLLAACGSNTSDSTDADSAADASAPTANGTATNDMTEATADSVSGTTSADVLAGFDAFADTVTAFTSGDVWMVECNGIPMHQMMVGITSWQQQVPVAQDYTGANAWQFPVTPRLASRTRLGAHGAVPRSDRARGERDPDLQRAQQPWRRCVPRR